jgi:hypothetical protein
MGKGKEKEEEKGEGGKKEKEKKRSEERKSRGGGEGDITQTNIFTLFMANNDLSDASILKQTILRTEK